LLNKKSIAMLLIIMLVNIMVINVMYT